MQQLGAGKNIGLLVKIEAQNTIKPHKFPKIVYVYQVDILASEIAWSDGGRREIVSPLVADDGQQTFFSLIRWDLVFLLSKVLTTLQ